MWQDCVFSLYLLKPVLLTVFLAGASAHPPRLPWFARCIRDAHRRRDEASRTAAVESGTVMRTTCGIEGKGYSVPCFPFTYQ
jgi:hypothetical protein